jgi:hypothetical protein
MQMTDSLKAKIAADVGGCDTIAVEQFPAIGETNRKNELLMFIKPEIFNSGNQSAIQNSLDMIFQKLQEFNAEVAGTVIVGGQALEAQKCMDRHYGAINVLSRTASQVLSAEDRQKIYDTLGVSAADYPLYGGHEFQASHPGFTPAKLDELWFTKKSMKIRSGFYVQAYALNGEKFILINGFHPAQLAHFTEPSHRIVLLLIHSDTDWATLRDQMIGDTFPERAAAGSIRGTFYADPARYGFATVSIANNCVHLSAGPFEAMFEIMNFFGGLINIDVKATQPLIVRQMLKAGITEEQAWQAIENPIVTVDGKTKDLYGATEHKDTAPSIAIYQTAL